MSRKAEDKKKKEKPEEIKSDVVKSDDIIKLVYYSVDKYVALPSFIRLAEYLRGQQEFALVVIVCKKAQERLAELEKDRVAREIRLQKINKLEARLNEKREKEKRKGDLGDPLTDQEAKLWKWIQLEKSVTSFLPSETTLTQNANFEYQLQIAKLMIGSVLDSHALKEAAAEKAGEKIDDIKHDMLLGSIIDQCTEQVINPAHLKDLANMLSQKGKFDLALNVCRKAFERVQAMRTRLETKLKLDTQRVLLEQEEARLKVIKKGLTEQQKELLDTHKNIKGLPRIFSFDPEDNNAYDNLALDLTQLTLKIAMDNKQALKRKTKLVEKGRAVYTEKEKVAVADKAADKILAQVLEDAMRTGNVENPYQLTSIAEQLYTGEEWNLAYPVIAKARKRILELQDRFKKIQADKTRLAELQKERAKFFEQWKPDDMPKAKREELNRLESEDYVNEHFESRYKKETPERLDDLHIKVMKLLIDNMMTQYREAAVEYEDKAQQLLDSIEKPSFLYLLAKHIESNWKVASDVVIKFGEKCQNITRKVEEGRQRRAPLTHERDEMRSKIQDLEARNRDVKKEDRERLAHLEKQIAALPPWPEYAKLDDPYQYDELNLDVVRVMISAILNSKVEFDEKTAKLRKETDPSKIDNAAIDAQRQKIQQGIQDMVKNTLERFANPADLLKVARDMKARQEVDIVLQISVKCLQRITDIEVQRNLRNKILERLEEAKTAKDKSKVTENEKKLSDLPVWPHYAKLADPTQYANTKYEIIKVAMDSVLEHQTKVEANISQMYYMDKKRADEKKIKEQRDAMENNINQVVKLSNNNLKDADRLFDIGRDLSSKKQAGILLKIAPAFFDHIRSLEKIRQTKDQRDSYYEVLSEEKSELQRIKKELPEKLDKELSDIEKERKEEAEGKKPYKYPSDLKDSDGLNRYLEDFTSLLVRTTFATNQQIEQNIAEDTEKDLLTEARIAYLQSRVTENLTFTIEMILRNVHNPVFISTIVRQFNDKGLFEESIRLGLDALEKRGRVADLQDQNQGKKDRIQKLEAEKAELDKRRKKLTKEQTEDLRGLYLDVRLFRRQPNYVTSIRPQQLAFDISKELIVTMQRAKTDQKRSDEVLSACLNHLTEVPILIEFAKYLTDKTEYRHTIRAGKKCEDLIKQFYLDLDKREELKKRVTELDEKRLKSLAAPGAGGESGGDPKIKEDLENAKKQLEQLPEVEYDKSQLDSWMLDISAVIINAAKIEDDDDTLCEQTVMAFKIDTSIERWDQVRNMVSDENWERIKDDLVQYILKREDNPVDKIELLMKDGLYQYCINLFPAATGKGKELDLLLRLWSEVEEHEPKLLEQFIPLVCRYVKRYYQEHKYNMVDPLLDKVAHWFPSLVIEVYRQACDMVLLWILPSQYTRFCEAMKSCKKRLEDLNRVEDWNALLRDFKRQHYGKRKLLQMLLAVVDDPDWNLETVLEGKKNV